MASSSSSPSSLESSVRFPCKSEVFLNSTGEGTAKAFIDHLYTALKEAGFHTYIDKDDKLELEAEKAIQESKLSVVVFSSEYASSTRCLNQLVMITDRRKGCGLMHVLPVFYHVDPSHVRWQTGNYAAAFATDCKEVTERWRLALKEIANLSGMVLKDQLEAQFIREVVELVGNKLNSKLLYVEPHLVGIDSYVERINLWLQDESTDVGFLSIYGMVGVGKTAIAKTVYNHNCYKFEGSCFLENVRQASKLPDDFRRLQEQLLSNISNRTSTSNKTYGMDEGINKIEGAICCKKLLIVIDDVDDMSLFDYNLILNRDWISAGSKIILTTRRESLLVDEQGSSCKVVHVEPLDDVNSLSVFSFHAFGKHYPPNEDFRKLSESVVRHCGGLPLALYLLGNSLSCEKSIDVWTSAIQEMKDIPNARLQKNLATSLESLQNDDKNLFLHIACFFVGMDRDFVVKILDGCGFDAVDGIERLNDRCIVVVNGGNEIVMHQLIRDMGREIVRQECHDHPGRRSRLWNHQDAFNVLTDETGTEKIKGLALDMNMLKDSPIRTSSSYGKRCYENYLAKSLPDHQQNSKHYRLGGRILSILRSYIPKASADHLIRTGALAKMRELNLLQLNNVRLDGEYRDFPKHLVWLCWHGFPLESIPDSFCLEKLVVLDLRNSSLRDGWQGNRCLPSLKILDLSHSHELGSSPNFRGMPHLERLIMKDCINLVKIDESIGVVKELAVLNLEGCKKMRKLPNAINRLKSQLKVVIMTGCSQLKDS